MSRIARVLSGLGLVAFIAACAPKVEEVTVFEQPVTTEPSYTGKFK